MLLLPAAKRPKLKAAITAEAIKGEKELIAPPFEFRDSAIKSNHRCLILFGFVSSRRVLSGCKSMNAIEADLVIRVVVAKPAREIRPAQADA